MGHTGLCLEIILAVKPDFVIVEMQVVFSSAAVVHAAKLMAFVILVRPVSRLFVRFLP